MPWAGAMAYILLVVLRLEAHKESRRFLVEVMRFLQQQTVKPLLSIASPTLVR